jgi:hypothetical protein
MKLDQKAICPALLGVLSPIVEENVGESGWSNAFAGPVVGQEALRRIDRPPEGLRHQELE